MRVGMLLFVACATACMDSRTVAIPEEIKGESRGPARNKDARPPDSPAPLPSCEVGKWTCDDGTCRAPGGLPASSGTWHCHLRAKVEQWSCGGDMSWLCYGYLSPADPTPNNDCDWRCEELSIHLEKTVQQDDLRFYRCERPATDSDFPPGTMPTPNCKCALNSDGSPIPCVACERSSLVEGTVCYQDELPEPPYLTNDDCEPGARYWCESWKLSGRGGWGQVTCSVHGSWPTVRRNGEDVLDCGGHARRPVTLCACYHTFFNRDCCERPDCRIPEDAEISGWISGWVCPYLAGATCSYCDLSRPTMCQPGICATSAAETFCVAACEAEGDCPDGETCMTVAHGKTQRSICMPDEQSCYWRE